jgi:hypothetical protein
MFSHWPDHVVGIRVFALGQLQDNAAGAGYLIDQTVISIGAMPVDIVPVGTRPRGFLYHLGVVTGLQQNILDSGGLAQVRTHQSDPFGTDASRWH